MSNTQIIVYNEIVLKSNHLKIKNIAISSFVIGVASFIVVQTGNPNANFNQLKTYQQILAIIFYISLCLFILSVLILFFRFIIRRFKPSKSRQKTKIILKTSVARKYKILYAYVVITILVQQPLVLYQLQRTHDSASYKAYPTATIISIAIGIAINVLINLYLIFTKNLTRLLLVLKIILTLQVIGLISLLLRDINSYNFIISLLVTPLTYFTYRAVSGKKQTVIV